MVSLQPNKGKGSTRLDSIFRRRQAGSSVIGVARAITAWAPRQAAVDPGHSDEFCPSHHVVQLCSELQVGGRYQRGTRLIHCFSSVVGMGCLGRPAACMPSALVIRKNEGGFISVLRYSSSSCPQPLVFIPRPSSLDAIARVSSIERSRFHPSVSRVVLDGAR